ncbi:MAG: metalloregulator ArsR/SmtB family transcription factor [Proteobacteria bacterium]|nr:metalloregulator ArsR/SmtB family transcription factor [Pseudomonadota bacterium]MBI3497719.1 metalloregulator ArsR/SmtB family transcription factor [Pseudomonadota bacterium]
MSPARHSVQSVLGGLRAAAESTRLRVLSLCAEADLTVSDLTQVLGQSQPRVSRHLKLMCEAGLLERNQEGSWAFFRVARTGPGAAIATALNQLLPNDDEALARDHARLESIRQARAEAASAYFRANAAEWHRIRTLHVDDREVERALGGAVPMHGVDDLLDVGTGTGRMLELFGPRIARGLGIDTSREMLALARANLDRVGLRHCAVRHGDMYHLPLADRSFDAVIVHQVLHYAEHPERVIAEAARVVRPGGRLAVIDFAPHALEELRLDHAHRRLGFPEEEIAGWLAAVGLAPEPARNLVGQPLTVSIWIAKRPAETVALRRVGAGGRP